MFRAHAEEHLQLDIVVYPQGESSPLDTNDLVLLEDSVYEILAVSNQSEILWDVTIQVPWADPVVTSPATPSFLITAPGFEAYPQFIITAMKTGYTSVEVIVIKEEAEEVLDELKKGKNL